MPPNWKGVQKQRSTRGGTPPPPQPHDWKNQDWGRWLGQDEHWSASTSQFPPYGRLVFIDSSGYFLARKQRHQSRLRFFHIKPMRESGLGQRNRLSGVHPGLGGCICTTCYFWLLQPWLGLLCFFWGGIAVCEDPPAASLFGLPC